MAYNNIKEIIKEIEGWPVSYGSCVAKFENAK